MDGLGLSSAELSKGSTRLCDVVSPHYRVALLGGRPCRYGTKIIVASRWAHRFPLVALSNRSSSASVRYSRVRRSALGRRVGTTVRFSVAGVTSFRCDLTKVSRFLAVLTVRTTAQVRTVCNRVFLERLRDRQSPLVKWVPFSWGPTWCKTSDARFQKMPVNAAAAARLRPHVWPMRMIDPKGNPCVPLRPKGHVWRPWAGVGS
jgi:hypothetical protein